MPGLTQEQIYKSTLIDLLNMGYSPEQINASNNKFSLYLSEQKKSMLAPARRSLLILGLSSIGVGCLAGIPIAIYRKSGILGGVGWVSLISISAFLIGTLVVTAPKEGAIVQPDKTLIHPEGK